MPSPGQHGLSTVVPSGFAEPTKNAPLAPAKPPTRSVGAVCLTVRFRLPQPETAPADAAPPARFGAKDVFDLSWKNLLDAYSCTECGRCTAACPANITGKLLSPRKIMMQTRDRLEEVGKQEPSSPVANQLVPLKVSGSPLSKGLFMDLNPPD